jgi:hypothetical protein
MQKAVHFLRLAYWVGAIMDALMLFPMLIPSVGAAMFAIADFHPGPEYRYAMGLGASLMAGWTVLLLWGSHKPLERRGLIRITILPVILGLAGANIYAAASGLVEVGRIAPMLILQGMLAVFYLAVYLHSDPKRLAG